MEAEVAVLGELRITVHGGDLTPTAPREKCLLALLTVHRGRAVSTDRLATELWPDLAGDRARRVVQVRVADLRRRFGRVGAAALVESSPSGYRLHLQPGAMDVERFETLVDCARGLSADGDPVAAADKLREGLALWRGPPYADIGGSVTVEGEAVRLEALHQVALEAWAAAELAIGNHHQVEPELASIVAAHPLRERLWELWILAMYRCGRQADALRACTAIKRRLGDELGVEPGAGLRDLEVAVLQQRPGLDWPQNPAGNGRSAGATEGAPGASQPAHTETPATRVTVVPPATNLPLVEPLIGRDVEVAEVAGLVRARRLVTVTGTGGVGKSHLATTVAATLAPENPGGTWLVELAPLADGSGLIGAIAGAVPLPAMATTADDLAAQIGDLRMLVVLDNCEHLVDRVAPLTSTLLRSCAGIRVLCTSQEALEIRGEHVWPLQPLPPGAAAELFDQRARAVRPTLPLEPATVTAIVEHLDRVPLAIELAAARVATFSPEEIATRLDDRLRFLSGGPRDAPARHHSLRALVDWSHGALEPEVKRVYRRLAVFAGGFTADAASQVAASPGEDPDAFVDHLDHLVRRSLVVADVTADQTRYRLLETLRHHAAERLAAAGEVDDVRRRHADWCIAHAAHLELFANADEDWYLRRARDELDNFGAAVAWAVARRDTDRAVRLVAGLWRLHVLWRAELLEWAHQVLALPGARVHHAIGYVHLIIADLTWPSGRIDDSERAAREALRHPLEEDAWWSACSTHSNMLFYQGRTAESGAALVSAKQRLQSDHGRVLLRAKRISGEAFGARSTGLDPMALVSDADATGSTWARWAARQAAAFAFIGRGRPGQATALVHEALAIVEPGLNRLAVSVLNETFGLIAEPDTDRPGSDDVAERAARALALGRDYPVGLGYALVGLVHSTHRLGRHDDAALLAGYLSANSLRLAVPHSSTDRVLGRPLGHFATTATQASFGRGRAMTPAQLDAELERLASGGRANGT